MIEAAGLTKRATQWTHVGTALALWMLLPLLLGIWRITGREVAS